jgi:APA family basic amino acid/polyamine antiporter
LGLFDSTTLVVGVMIGSGIFLVSADMARLIGSPGWLLVAWGIAGALTIAGALSYGELSAMMPQAGGMYVYLREAYSPLWGFLYGWTLFSVIQTGTIAAVAVAFARFSGVLWAAISEERYLIAPVRVSTHCAFSLSTAQLLAIAIIALLTLTNTRGLRYGRAIQNLFTVAKTVALVALIAAGIFVGRNATALHENFGNLWHPRGFLPLAPGLDATTGFGLFVALCLSQTGSLFSADSWHNIAFAAGEVKRPERNVTRAMVIGTASVITLYFAGKFCLPPNASLAGNSARASGSRWNRHSPSHFPRYRRSSDGSCHHDLHLWHYQRADSHGISRLLCHGEARTLLPAWRRVECSPGACIFIMDSRVVGSSVGSAAYL